MEWQKLTPESVEILQQIQEKKVPKGTLWIDENSREIYQQTADLPDQKWELMEEKYELISKKETDGRL